MAPSASLDPQLQAGGSVDKGMEVHVRNVPQQSTENNFRKFLMPYFAKLSIQGINCQKGQGKKWATLTFLRSKDAENFLLHHGQAPRGKDTLPSSRLLQRQNNISGNLRFLGMPIYCEKSNKEANPYLLRVLSKEEKDRKIKSTTPAPYNLPPKIPPPKILPVEFECATVACGVWNYIDYNLVFEPQKQWEFEGRAKFGEHSMIMISDSGFRIDFRYFATYCITAEDGTIPALIFSMREAPRFFQKIKADVVSDLMAQLGLQNRSTVIRKAGPDRHRLSSLDDEHQQVAGSCLVYRITLRKTLSATDRSTVGNRIRSLRHASEIFNLVQRRVDVHQPEHKFSEAFDALLAILSSATSDIPFVISFQIQKLAQSGYLNPRTVIQLIPAITKMMERTPTSLCVSALRKLFKRIDYAGPNNEASEFDIKTIIHLLEENESNCKQEGEIGMGVAGSSSNMATIHRATVTPTGISLQGPDEEANNRVLRKYPQHHEHFLRVQFCDEDGEPVRFNPRISNEKIYHGRFKNILEQGIKIAGRTYSFLGFSHSSLRAQSCWFMAPFIFDGSLLWDRTIIEDLGNFTNIRSPAKCAARIGQAFSDTRNAVTIDPNIVINVPDVEANGRVFSDGVGTMSFSVMIKIWDSLPKAKLVKPTLFQIRFQGAKGMISYDSRLRGDALVLRPSMIKFEGSTWPDIEICEAAYKPLPMYLNRQFIKILEDMGVEDKFFLDLQVEEVNRLRSVTESPTNAATFLRRHTIGTGIHLPWLISKLEMLNQDFRKDEFLRNVVEMVVLMELRLLKHKTRIPVKNGWHLHGLMDETGLLEEGQIYCSVTIEGITTCIEGKDLVISRAPALHPGDIQVASGIVPPIGHPLSHISNCIVFSSKGTRDLPSQLSGGDLDGDRYYIMWDKRARPKQTFPPADYPRLPPLDIGRRVTRSDMTDHFIKFMETDQLGRIAVLHRVLADQKELGTLDTDCILLSEMHSTAVDFSKTGIPVDMSKTPKTNPWRPDFEAAGPHVKVEKTFGVSFELPKEREPDDRGDDDDDFSAYRYYESHKVLGKLYRAIDERSIFDQIKQRSLNYSTQSHSTVINSVWAYVQAQCRGFQWKHHLEWARGIRDMYDEKVSDIMINSSDNPSRPLSELEAFIGNILGKTGAQSRRQRDLSVTMKERFEEDSVFIVNCIVKDGTEWSEESLERSMACLGASLEESKAFKRQDQLLSFKYVAAAVCLREVERLPVI